MTTDLQKQLTAALVEGATVADLVAMRLAVRAMPIHDVHNALSGALEDIAAAKFRDEITGGHDGE